MVWVRVKVRSGQRLRPMLASGLLIMQLRLKQQLLRSKDRNGNCLCRDSDVVFPVTAVSIFSLAQPHSQPNKVLRWPLLVYTTANWNERPLLCLTLKRPAADVG